MRSNSLLLRGPSARLALGIVLAAIASALYLGLHLDSLSFSSGNFEVSKRFLMAAFQPATAYQAEFVPRGTTPLIIKAISAAGMTFVFAAAAMSIAIPLGFLLGIVCSRSWWFGNDNKSNIILSRFVYRLARSFASLIRSVHELLWAILFLAAFGISEFSAVIAIALPYTGILAKLFSEIIDETSNKESQALRASGASSTQAFLFASIPLAVPNLCAYTLYRFECALRSSAILGFFGFPTLGYYIAASFENLYYNEVWTYLYVLVAMIVIVDRWSSAMRKELVV